jgi:uncharacterized membrane protein YcaP (DUF421 family)
VWFESWGRVGTTFAAGATIYVFVVAMLRISGKRTLAKLNAFDFVVTIALGSTVASAVVSREVPLAEAAAALTTLVGLQFAVAWIATRWRWIRPIVTASPVALVVDGELQRSAMAASRITDSEIGAALRKRGFGSVAGIDRVVLETDGSISVIEDAGDGSALAEVHLSVDRTG